MNRILFLLHRYIGITLGLLLSIWCLSGIVMMYVQYPRLSATEAAAGLEALDLTSCCTLPDDIDTIGHRPLDSLRIEMLAGEPVLQLAYADGDRMVFDLGSGQQIGPFSASDADAIASHFAATTDIAGFNSAGPIERDQWTVYGAYDPHRPLLKFVGDDPAGTTWYVSSRTGEIVQRTTAHERFWNWLGAVPHWLYPTLLRQHTALWSQIVIWLSIVATFLTVLGIYVGLRQWKSRRSGRYSPYRGAGLWHHYAGLVFGTLMLTWLVSGFFSMNPWGALESRSVESEAARQRGADLVLAGVLQHEIERFGGHELPADTVRLEARIVDSTPFFVSSSRDGTRQRLEERIEDVLPFTRRALLEAAARMRPDVAVSTQGWIDAGDAYYYNHHDTVDLPVYRIIYADGDRFYLDRLTGDIVATADSSARWYRWVHYGLHRGDLTRLIRSRPIWDLLMLPLMLGVSLSALTGTWIGIRRIRRWIHVN